MVENADFPIELYHRTIFIPLKVKEIRGVDKETLKQNIDTISSRLHDQRSPMLTTT